MAKKYFWEIPEDETAEDLAWLMQKFQGVLEVRL